MCITKASFSKSKAIVINSFLLISSNHLILKNSLITIFIFYSIKELIKFILIFLKIKKNILRAISMLISANQKKIFFRKQDFSFLSFIEKETITIPKISSFDLPIF